MPKVGRGVPEIAPAEDEVRTGTEYADDIDFVPTTDFGRRLLELRRRIIAEQGTLDRAGLEREIAERRGGVFTGPER